MNETHSCYKQVIKGQAASLRLLPTSDINKALPGIVTKIGVLHLGASTKNNIKGIGIEITKYIYKHFKQLGLNEIEYAFELANAGKLDVDAKAYYGTLTTKVFGDVLNSYLKYRKKIAYKISHAKDLMQQQERKEIERKAKNAKARENVFEEFAKAQNGDIEFKSYDKIPAHWAKILIEAGLITGKNQKLYNECKKKVEDILAAQLFNKEAPPIVRSQAKSILKGLKEGRKPAKEAYDMKVLTMYKQKLVFNALKGKE